MATTEAFLMPAGPDFDPDTFGQDSGAVELTGLTHDVDGDGVLDTVTFTADDAMVVASDMDADGVADHLTFVGDVGEYAAWEFHRDENGSEHWEMTDSGTLG